MGIPILPRDPSPLEALFTGLGTGFQQSFLPQFQQTMEGQMLQNILGEEGIMDDPKKFTQAILTSGLSPQTKQQALSSIKAFSPTTNLLQERKEMRLQRGEISDQYNRLIGDVQSSLKEGLITDRDEAKKLMIDLRREQQKNLENLKEGKPAETDAIQSFLNQFVEENVEQQRGFLERLKGLFSSNETNKLVDDFTKENPPAKFEGRTATHPATGQKLRSDGKKWIIVEG